MTQNKIVRIFFKKTWINSTISYNNDTKRVLFYRKKYASQAFIQLPRKQGQYEPPHDKWFVRPAKTQISLQSDQSLHCPHEESLVP